MKKTLQQFDHPENRFRGTPFWAWNAALEPEKLRQQIREMHQMGFGGFFMHSRTGLRTPYLGKKWFECIHSCIDEAEKLHMDAWLYDEDRWPSGAAGGAVTADDRFKARHLKFCPGESIPENTKLIARFALKYNGAKLEAKKLLQENEQPPEGVQVFSFYREYMARSSWYNGETYLDTLNPAAVEKFVEVTHEVYKKECGNKFGKSVPGIFSDEPCYIHGDASDRMPWTDDLPEKFQERYGYDLIEHLPELFFDTESEVSRARHDYFDLLSALFSEAFSGTIGKWCAANNMIFTGHLLGEDLLSTQTLYISSAMRFYEHMQLPAVDVLTEHWNVFNAVKQCVSSARQFGKRERLTETYACTGWDFPLSGHKALADWQFALGINRRCHHLIWYSMEAEGKRDYPASISSHSPWFREYKAIEDYFARLGALLSGGEEVRDLLVIHPLESLWGVMIKNPADSGGRKVKPGCKVLDGFDSPRILQLDRDFTDLTNLLLRENLDFDFGDEEIISRIGKVNDGELKVGCADYKMVLLPALKTIRSTTLDLLAEIPEKVFYLGKAPEFVDAQPSDRAAQIYRNFTQVTWENAAELIGKHYRRVSITDNQNREIPETLYHLSRFDDGSWAVFLVNTSMEFTTDIRNAPLVRDRSKAYKDVRLRMRIPENAGQVYELDLQSGKKYPVTSELIGEYLSFTTSLAAIGSRFFIVTKEAVSPLTVKPELPETAFLKTLPSQNIPYSLSEENKLVLDHALCRVNGELVCENRYILLLDDDLRENLGEPPRGGLMVQPWQNDPEKQYPELKIELEYTFSCASVPQHDCRLLMEHPELYEIEFNGTLLSNIPESFWMEDVLQGIPLARNLFRDGKNTLLLRSTYHCGQRGLETIFISGKFGVRNESLITTLPETVNCGDLRPQALCNYAGNISYFFDLDEPAESLLLNFRLWRGTMLGIRVDSGEMQLLYAPPYCLMIPGKCRLEICVFGHRRNALGPFYHGEAYPVRTGPYQYKLYVSSDRTTVPYGLLEMPELRTIAAH